MKKIFSFILSTITVIALSCSVFASGALGTSENLGSNKDYQDYITLVNQGVLDNTISFEYWQEIKARSAELEKILENSHEFSEVYDSRRETTFYLMQAGDVFITNGTSSSGLTGHSGIAISSDLILHIEGPGKTPKTISLTAWKNRYNVTGWTKVYRYSLGSNLTKVPYEAAKWAEKTYRNSNAQYVINTNLASTDKTYCSKLVWQAYYYGPTTHCANGPTIGIRTPYDLPTTIHNLQLTKTLN